MASECKRKSYLFRKLSKNVMAGEEANEYLEVDDAHVAFFCGMPTIEATEKALQRRDEDSALGPDMVPTRL